MAASIYQWVVVYSILFFLYHMFKPYHAEVIGQLIAVASLWGLIVMPLYQLGKFFYVPGRLEKVKKLRMFLSLSAILGVLAAVLFIPLPHWVMASTELQPHEADEVYVAVPEGAWLVRSSVRPGQTVVKGQELAVLENKELQAEIAKDQTQEKEREAKLEGLLKLFPYDRKVAENIPEARKELDSVRELLAKEQSQRDRLTLRAGQDGTVLPPPPTQKQHSEDIEGAPLPSWSGIPMDERHCRPYLREGVLYCEVGDPRKLEAVLVIDQGDVEFVQQGQSVDLKFDALPGDVFHGKIERISNSNLKIMPKRLGTRAGGEVPTHVDPETNIETPQSPSYQALVPIDDTEGVLRIGLRGEAKIHTVSLSIYERLYRFIANTFHFRL